MHFLWLFFLQKRQLSVLFILALIGLGVYAAVSIPKESAPEIIVPIGIVTTVLPGASALDVEELVTNPLEDSIGNIDGLDKLTSSSRDGLSMITAEFDTNADIDKSIQDLKDAVDSARAELPRDATQPVVSEVNFAEQPIFVISVSSALEGAAFTALGEDLSSEFLGVQGVSKAVVEGTRDREIQVVVEEAKLAQYNLSLSAITGALQGNNLTLPVGTVTTEDVEYAIRYEGKINDPDEISNIPVGSFGGEAVYIRDVGHVYNGVSRENTLSRVSTNGAPAESALTLSLFKRSGVDVTEMAKAVNEKLVALQKEGELLGESQVLIVFDQGEQVRKDLSDLIEVGFETVILVVLCLLLTIGWRESVVAALSIPLSFVIAFIGLYMSGNTINFISLFALILAIGILVDSGIVITEAIHTRMRKFEDADRAAAAALKEYAWPLIAGTMTTVAVFAPLFFISGIVGKFIASIPFTIIFVLLASIVVALGMVPLIAIYLTRESHGNRFEEIQEEYTHKTQVWYREQLVRFLHNKKAQRIFLWSLTIGLFLALLLPVTGLLKVIFFPPEDVEFVFIEVEATQGTPVQSTDLTVRAVEEFLYEKPYVESFTSTVGAGSPFTGNTNSGGKFANITVTLKEGRTESSAEIANDLRDSFKDLKGADITVAEQMTGPPTGAPINIKFIGDNLGDLALATESATRILSTIDGVRDVNASTKNAATELVLKVDTARANEAGIPAHSIGEVLRAAVFGTIATTITENGEDIDIVVKLGIDPDTTDPSATPRVTLDDIRNLSVTNQFGQNVLLGSLMVEELGAANATIAHEDEERVESVSASVEAPKTATEVMAEFTARTGELTLPPGVRLSYGGETEDINKTFTEMAFAFIAGLVLMLAILVLSFNSIRYALYLLLAVPLSLIGVFVGLALTGQALSFTSLLGVIALAGVIINHAIILMDSMIHFHTTRADEALIDIVADAAVSRLRPIVLTTITTVIGMIPLSTISDFWSPLAYAIMFGLTFAMILTLVLVPTLYYRAEKKKLERKRPTA